MSSDVKVSSASLPVHKVQTDLLEPGTGEGPQDSSIGTSCRGQGKIQGLVVSGNMSNEYWSWSVKNFRKNLKKFSLKYHERLAGGHQDPR